MNAGAGLGDASDPILRALERLEALDPLLLHGVLGFGAFLENVFPPVPADTFVAVGGVLAGRGVIPLWSVAVVVGLANVGGAWLVYLLGRRYGHAFFADGPGRWILSPQQLERAERWHAKKGGMALFLLRFLPALRSVAPAFAGIGGLSASRVAVPLLSASFLWYGGLLWAGHAAGQNLEALARWIGQLNTSLTIAAGAVVLGTLWWWRSSRRAGKG
jgi:membrane protein DedA with SNARE-associated domain